MYLKQPLWDGVGHIIEEEQTTELMYSDQGGNICFFMSHLSLIMSLSLAALCGQEQWTKEMPLKVGESD